MINLRLLSSQTVSMAGQIVVNVSWLLIMVVLLAKSQRAIDSTYCKFSFIVLFLLLTFVAMCPASITLAQM